MTWNVPWMTSNVPWMTSNVPWQVVTKAVRTLHGALKNPDQVHALCIYLFI
jgi:hypothetical protein